MQTVDILKATRSKLSNPAHWTKGVSARTKSGRPVYCGHEHAVCWCLVSAVNVVEPDDYIEANRALTAFAQANNLHPQYLVAFNDDPSRTHEEILSALDKAIQSCESTSS